MKQNWKYQGDINLHYGGFFANLDKSDLKYGYCDVVRITDLDSGCGYETAVLVEHLTVLWLDDVNKIKNALSCCGWISDLPKKNTNAYWMMLIDAFLFYGYYDPADSWDNYRSSYCEVIQQEKTGSMSYDGWTADINLQGKSLKRYIHNNHLR